MEARKLSRKLVEKPWGRLGLAAHTGADPAVRTGEIWFESPPGRPLDVMVKYLFTEERLSIQVHPDDATARARGHAHGKDECWLIVDVAGDAELGLGLKQETTPDAAIAAARDGSIVALMDWRRPRRGDFIYNPAGTIHALGPGLTVIEIQQPIDLTYRLYDYDRPRPLQLEEARAVVRPGPHRDARDTRVGEASRILVDGPELGVAWCVGTPPPLPASLAEAQLIAVDGSVGGVEPGECALISRAAAEALRGDGRFVLAWSTTGH